MGRKIDDFSESGWDKVMDLNVKGMFLLLKTVAIIKTSWIS